MFNLNLYVAGGQSIELIVGIPVLTGVNVTFYDAVLGSLMNTNRLYS